ncbi:MAG TPA: VWA domain-containing protein [Pyrinomonadaceae bacterium]|nr:VWA domain-containing protein [Pyrinomonadaceae bacterium]
MRLFSKYSSLLAVGFCLWAVGISALAQETAPTQPVEAQGRKVRLNVLVTDSAGRAITDLRQEEFRIVEDGKQQTITSFSREEVPVSYGLVVDSSGSMRTLLDHIINAGKTVVESSKPGDEGFVLRFTDSDNIQIEHGFTTNKDALAEALDGIYVEGGQTALMDAINRSLDFLKKYRRGDEGGARRLAIILVSDGEERGSRARNQEALLTRLREEDVQFFVIGLSKLGDLQGSRDKAAELLTRIAEVSGGRVFFPKSAGEIPGIADEIARDLHAQYVIGYTPAGTAARDGAFHKVQVTVPDSQGRKKLNVIARQGYVAPR